jgi:FKBP-type peptidyl-prolyl cis-trans isomerase FkpA
MHRRLIRDRVRARAGPTPPVQLHQRLAQGNIMRHILTASLALVLCAASAACAKSADPELKTDDDKTLYAIGIIVGGNLKNLGLSPDEYARVRMGIEHTLTDKKPLVEMQEWGPKVSTFASKRGQEQATKQAAVQKEKDKSFVATATKADGAKVMPSGLIFRTIKAGKGDKPSASSTVKVHYEGKLTDGTVFDSSRKRNEPATFPLGGVIKCWTEGVAMMQVGETAQLVCPSDIAYGDRGHPPTIPAGATLSFEVELLSIEGAPAASTPPTAGK